MFSLHIYIYPSFFSTQRHNSTTFPDAANIKNVGKERKKMFFSILSFLLLDDEFIFLISLSHTHISFPLHHRLPPPPPLPALMAPRPALLLLAALCASPGPAVEVSASSPTTGRLLPQALSMTQQSLSLSLLGPSRPLLAGRVAMQPAAASGDRSDDPYASGVESYVVRRGGGRGRRGGGVAKSAVAAPSTPPAVAAASSSSSSPPSLSPALAPAPAPSVAFLPPALPAASRSSRKLLQNTRLETSLTLASDLTGPISPATGSALGGFFCFSSFVFFPVLVFFSFFFS